MTKQWWLGMLGVLVAFAARGEMYRWVDARGVVNYGERPPAGVKAVPLGERGAVSVVPAYEGAPEPPPPPPPSPTEQRIDRLEQQLSRERSARQQMQADEAARREAARQRCLNSNGVDCDNAYDSGDDLTSPGYRVYQPYPGWNRGRGYPSQPVGNSWGNVNSGTPYPAQPETRSPARPEPKPQPRPQPAPQTSKPTPVERGVAR